MRRGGDEGGEQRRAREEQVRAGVIAVSSGLAQVTGGTAAVSESVKLGLGLG